MHDLFIPSTRKMALIHCTTPANKASIGTDRWIHGSDPGLQSSQVQCLLAASTYSQIHVLKGKLSSSAMLRCFLTTPHPYLCRATVEVAAGLYTLNHLKVTCFQVRPASANTPCCRTGFGSERVWLDTVLDLPGEWFLCIPRAPTRGKMHDFHDIFLVRVRLAVAV